MVHLIHRKWVPLLHNTVMILCDEGDGLVAVLNCLVDMVYEFFQQGKGQVIKKLGKKFIKTKMSIFFFSLPFF